MNKHSVQSTPPTENSKPVIQREQKTVVIRLMHVTYYVAKISVMRYALLVYYQDDKM